MKKYLIALLVIACNIGNQGKVFANTSNDGNAKKVSGVYVFGYERDMSDNVNFEEYPDGKANSVYWKDGKSTIITDEIGIPEGYDEFDAQDMIIVNGERVYWGYAKKKENFYLMPFIYNKGKFTRLQDSELAEDMKLCCVGEQVKVVGCLENLGNDQGIEKFPAIWDEDGNMTTMEMGEYTNCSLEDIAVSGNDVYACGRIFGDDIWQGVGAVWKNGKLTTYPAPDGGITMFGFTAIGVSGNDVYTTMVSRENKETDDNSLTLWKNGKMETVLVKNNNIPMAECIVIDGNDVYVGGTADKLTGENNTVINMPRIWKNGKPMTIDKMNEMGRITSIVVYNGNVYAAGDHIFSGALWTNGKMKLIPGAEGERSAWKVILDVER